MASHAGASGWLERDSDEPERPTSANLPTVITVNSNGAAGSPTSANALSLLSDENEPPLARPISRRDRFFKLTSVLTRLDSPPYHQQQLQQQQPNHSYDQRHNINVPSSKIRRDTQVLKERLLTGLHSRPPERSSYVLKNRRYATMIDTSETHRPELSRCAGDVRLRQEHIAQVSATAHSRRLFWPPILLPHTHGNGYAISPSSTGTATSTSASIPSSVADSSSPVAVLVQHGYGNGGMPKVCGLSVVRNALAREMDGLQRIVHSLELRKYDVCASDIHAFYAWFKLIENFIRTYFYATEVSIYSLPCAERRIKSTSSSSRYPHPSRSPSTSPSPPSSSNRRTKQKSKKLKKYHKHQQPPQPPSRSHQQQSQNKEEFQGEQYWNPSKRQSAKLRLLVLCENLEALRRPMIAIDRKAHDLLHDLRRRCDKLSTQLMQFVDGEVQIVEPVVHAELSGEELDLALTTLVDALRNTKGGYGRDLVLLMATGLGVGKTEREIWVRDVGKVMSRVLVQLSMKKLTDRHWNFVTLFETAGKEYQQLYEDLARDLDMRIAALRRDPNRFTAEPL